MPTDSVAQLEYLLRCTEPVEPVIGACGLYLFESEEASGSQVFEFTVCIESEGRDRSVVLHLWSADSLEMQVTVAANLFAGEGTLLENIQRVVEIQGAERRVIEAADWQDIPALASAPGLPVEKREELGERVIPLNDLSLQVVGQRIVEFKASETPLGDSIMTHSERRDLALWTSARAPLMGIVEAVVLVRNAISFSRPILGAPERKPAVSRYSLKLLAIVQPPHR